MFKWIQKKDLVYWLIIIIIVSLLSSDIGQTKRLVLDNWAFAGTVVSIILAVIAILYTFDQSSTTVASTKKLEESAKRVEDTTKELENNNISGFINELEERLSTILQEMQRGIHENITTNLEPIKSFFNLQNDSLSQDKKIKIFNDEEWKGFLEDIIVSELKSEGITLIYVYYLYVNKIAFTKRGTFNWLKTFTMEEWDSENLYGFIQGQIGLYTYLNAFDYKLIDEVSGSGYEITTMNSTIHDEIETILKNPKGVVKFTLDTLNKAFENKKGN